MAEINGSGVVIWLSRLLGPQESQKVLFTTNCTLTINHDLPDATSKDSDGYAENISGIRSWELTVEGLSDFGTEVTGGALENTDQNILDLWYFINSQSLSGKMAFAVDTDDSGSASEYYYGRVSVGNLELDNEMEATASFSGTLVGRSELTTTDPFPII